jgi:hypothetical protein
MAWSLYYRKNSSRHLIGRRLDGPLEVNWTETRLYTFRESNLGYQDGRQPLYLLRYSITERFLNGTKGNCEKCYSYLKYQRARSKPNLLERRSQAMIDWLMSMCQIKHTQRIDDSKILCLGNKLYLMHFIIVLDIGNHKTEAINSI